MRNLNKDEKQYINDELYNKIKNLHTESDVEENMNSLVKNEALANDVVAKTLNFLERIFTKDEVSKSVNIYQRYDKMIKVEINIDSNLVNMYSINILIKPSEDMLKEFSKQEELRQSVRELGNIFRNVNLEKYYILFSTWVAPNTERLNKINELIELIWSDFETNNSKLIKAIK